METTIPNTTVTPLAPGEKAPELFSTVVPKEYHDKAYLADILKMPNDPKAYDALFKKLDGAETLIGKKTGVPASDAKPEEWDQFFAKLRPENEDAYEIKGEKPDPVFAKTLKSAFFKAGLTKSQAAQVQDQFLGAIKGQQEAQAAAALKLDTEFEALSKATFGPENAKALERAKGMLNSLAPENLKNHIPSLSNEALVVLAGVLNAVHAKYGIEDNIDGKANASGVDEAGLREEARTLMASPEYKDKFNTKHDKTRARVDEIYAGLGKKG